MNKSLDAARGDFKAHAPRIVERIIDKSYIGAVIGPGGKIIQEIQETCGVVISIEEVDDKGVVNIASSDKESIEKALARLDSITFTPNVGDEYDAIVKTVMPYGCFVDFKNKSGLVHISELEHRRVERVEDVCKEGDEMRVKLIGIDQKTGKLKLSRKALLPRPERAERNDRG
jgi:polyribonucleotide nucleotidyltransferase